MSKFIVTFKTPDAVENALQDYPELDKDEANDVADKFLKWGEYLDVEFDTTTGTAKVLPQN